MIGRRVAIIVAAVLALCVGAGAAWAAWSSSGSGSAHALSTTVLPPTGANAASAGTGSVKITVTAGPTDATAVPPSGYRVDRLTPAASAATGVCTITGTTGNCTDSGADQAAHALASGTTYTYAVYGVFAGPSGTVQAPTWTSASPFTNATLSATTASAVVTHGYTLAATGLTGNPVAGTAFNVSITATANGATDTNYSGSKSLTWTGSQATGTTPDHPDQLPATATFTNGVATVSLQLFKAGARSFTATDTNSTTYTGSLTGTVNRADVQLSLTGTNCGTTALKGSPVSLTLGRPSADAYGNAVTATSGASVGVTVTATNVTTNSTQTVTIASSATSQGFNEALTNANQTNTVVSTNAPSGYTAAASCTITHN